VRENVAGGGSIPKRRECREEGGREVVRTVKLARGTWRESGRALLLSASRRQLLLQ
jgi:hypothetical protein